MPYTFAEAFDAVRDEQHLVEVTLVITQSDGRTAVSDHAQRPNSLTVGPGGARVLTNLSPVPADAILVRFNDRSAAVGSPPIVGSPPVPIPFAGRPDYIGLDISDQGGNAYLAQFTLFAWGGIKYSVQMSQPNQAKLLFGWGDTIGFGEPQALYVISFNRIVPWIK
jgi:hypothetical protein